MAEDQASSNEINEGSEAFEAYGDDDTTTVGAIIEDFKTTVAPDDYEDEALPDYVVNLAVNEQNEGDVQLTTKIVDAAITDINGNIIPSKTSELIDTINEYTSTIAGELDGETTAITGGKGLWGWSTKKLIIVALIALCILAIILALLFLVFGKKFKKNKKSPQTATASSSKQVASKGASADPKYQPVPNV